MKNELKIAMFGQKRVPSREGGVEVVVEELATRMVQLGHEVTCYNRVGHHVSGKEFDKKRISQYRNVRIKYVPTMPQKGFAALTSSFFAAWASAVGKYDVVHIHAEGAAVFCWLPKLFGKRVVVTIHGLDYNRTGKWGTFASHYILQGEKNAVRFADDIIVLSAATQDYFMYKYGRETTFISNGVNRPEIKKAKLIKVGYELDKNDYFLFLGRLVPEKGVHYLIEAFKKLKTNKKLVIAGGTSDSNDYVKKIKNMASCDERIFLTGFVEGELLGELYSNAFVYVLPSDLEGMPLSLLEAMSYGNCCLVSDIAECREVVENKAITFKQGNIEDLKDKLQTLCNNEEIVLMHKKEAADFICKKHDWNDTVNKTLKLYKPELKRCKNN